MKKFIATATIICALVIGAKAQSQTPEQQAAQIAQRMKDTLSLTDAQKSQIESATLTVQGMKTNMRLLYVGRALEYYLSMSETSRDSVYQTLLPADKYLLFKQKKVSLLGSY